MGRLDLPDKWRDEDEGDFFSQPKHPRACPPHTWVKAGGELPPIEDGRERHAPGTTGPDICSVCGTDYLTAMRGFGIGGFTTKSKRKRSLSSLSG